MHFNGDYIEDAMRSSSDRHISRLDVRKYSTFYEVKKDQQVYAYY